MNQKTTARFGRLLRPPTWKQNGPGIFWFRHFINLSVTYLDTYPLTYSTGTHTGLLHDGFSCFMHGTDRQRTVAMPDSNNNKGLK